MSYKLELEAVILAVLQDEPLHGYRISQAIKARGDGLLKLGDNQIYPGLHKLEKDGLVEAEWQMQEGKPPRKVYSLTESGRARLVVHRTEWDKYVATFSALIATKEPRNA